MQEEEKSIELTLIEEDFPVGNGNLRGYFEGRGPGLPHSEKFTAILDAVIVFSLERE